jgi:histidine kinase
MLVPILLVAIIMLTLRFYFVEQYNNSNNANAFEKITDGFENYYNHIVREIDITALTKPEKFQDSKFITEFNNEIAKNGYAIVIRKNEMVEYKSPIIENLHLEYELEPFGFVPDKNNSTASKVSSYKAIVKLTQKDFYFEDGSEGSIFVYFRTKEAITAINKLILFIMIFVVTILLTTLAVITYIVSKSIVNPLNKLNYAANEIRKGNLDCEVSINCKDEVGELYQSFEEMRKRLKESLVQQKQYEENRKELISNISHDLRTPITSIKGYIQGIKDGIADSPQKMEKYINTIAAKADDMDKLIEELFLFSKLDLKKFPFNFQKIDITEYLKDCVEELSFDLNKNNINLDFNYTEKQIFCCADAQQLKRVILNIITNSSKYFIKDKELRVVIDLVEKINNVEISISDNGIGISKEILPSIFGRFYRGDSARNTTTGGSGLGLAICKSIIEEHGGVIWAESKLGEGTCIKFTLPKGLTSG